MCSGTGEDDWVLLVLLIAVTVDKNNVYMQLLDVQ